MLLMRPTISSYRGYHNNTELVFYHLNNSLIACYPLTHNSVLQGCSFQKRVPQF